MITILNCFLVGLNQAQNLDLQSLVRMGSLSSAEMVSYEYVNKAKAICKRWDTNKKHKFTYARTHTYTYTNTRKYVYIWSTFTVSHLGNSLTGSDRHGVKMQIIYQKYYTIKLNVKPRLLYLCILDINFNFISSRFNTS